MVRNFLRLRRGERGDVPMVTMMVTFLMLAVLAATAAATSTAATSMTNTNRATAGVSASNLAGSASNALFSEMEADPHFLTDGGLTNFPQLGKWAQFGQNGAVVSCVNNHQNNCFFMTLTPSTGSSSAGASGPAGQTQQAASLSVKVRTDCNGVTGSCSTITTTQHLARRTFLDYLYFYDHSAIDPALQLPTLDQQYPAYATGDTVNGPVHTNGTSLDACGTPTFDGPVEVSGTTATWSSSDSESSAGCSGQPTFNAGFTGNAPVLPLPTSDAALSSIAADGGTPWAGQVGYSFSGNVTVALAGNSMTITDPNGGIHPGVPFPQTGVLYASGTLSVSGNDTGALTLASGGDVVVTGNVTTSGSGAVVGLEAQGSVVVDDSGSSVTVDAAMLALTHSVHTSVGPDGTMLACSSTCPTLTIDGGMASQYRGLCGQYDPASGRLVAGFAKSFTYDPRLYHLSPPWMTSQVAGEWMRSAPVSS